MYTKLKNSKFGTNIHILIIIVLAVSFFLYLYGFHVLDFTYTAWLFNGTDLSQHYIGWKFYRMADWQFPFGLFDTLTYPNQTSIIFADSIPLFALVFKILAPILPESFQYFGLWGILCFILQAVISAQILARFMKEKWKIVVGSLFFLMAPVYIYRMYMHSALAAQWLILLAIYFIVYRYRFRKWTHSVLAWSILGALCASIHLYFLPMCGIFLLVYLFLQKMEKKNWVYCTATLAGFLLSAVVIIWLFGGFTQEWEPVQKGLENIALI